MKEGTYELNLKRKDIISGDIWQKNFQDPVDCSDRRYTKFWEIPNPITYEAENNVVVIPVNKMDNEMLTARILNAVDYTSGDLLWQVEIPPGITHRHFYCKAGKKQIFVYTGDPYDEATLMAIDSKTGAIQWEVQVPGIEPVIPFFPEGFFIFHSNKRGSMFSFDVKTGKMEEYQGLFPTVPWRELLVYYSLENEGYSIKTISPGSHEQRTIYHEKFNTPSRQSLKPISMRVK